MDRVVYTAMSGAQQSLNAQAVISNNLANVATTGFREQLLAFRSVPVNDNSTLGSRVSVIAQTPGSEFRPGPVQYTGRTLDIAMKDNAWLAVRGADGTEAYTRRGDLQVDGNGQLTAGGFVVLGDGGPVQLPLGADLFIGEDGTFSTLGSGEDPDAVTQAGRLKLVDASTAVLVRQADGLFRPKTGRMLPASEEARIATQSLEGSNVSAVKSMVEMMSYARLFEMQMQVIQNVEKNDQRAANLLSLR
ncbi:flagellar biosynthesis protein FlgF [Halioglobus japonicus]|uniref:Flagellar basal-body rod protein FlgF n=1 Tax=Halioglobus japonicus TaxID=930805 RepID=A0AAP8ME23_9GAMM|nr:flagellar basal body rod protein FlgF [Halioglobus japonicus]AQA18083.1 flagellar biosynthesis protein FlgF [Halioglobus japonicus]PLW86075.1 flagellar basal body rod protein FlgF [Halioglobus japonicus]GHD14619.1 flagellar basal body protein [Halioglobus japonicus]